MLHGNKFYRLVVFGVAIVSLTVIGCAAQKDMWGGPQSGFILNYSISKDQVLNYTNNSDEAQTMEMMGQSMETTTKIDMDYSIKGTGTDSQNDISTQVTINRLDINSSSMMGATNPNTSGLKGKSFGLSFSPKGVENELIGIDDLPKIDLGQMGGGERSAAYYFSNLLPDLSDEPVKIGGTWTNQIDRKTQQGPIEIIIKGEAVSTLDGLETLNGMECLKIKTRTDSTVQGSGNMMGNDISMNGTVTSISTWYFAYKKGIFIKASSDDTSKMNMSLGAMGEMPVSSKTKREINLVL